MSVCAHCDHELGVGRFCTNCGRPVAETAGPARLQDNPRYPLYADQVAPDEFPRHASAHHHRRPLRWLPWTIGGVVLLLVAGLGIWLLIGDDDVPDTQVASDPSASSAPSPENQNKNPSPSPEPSTGDESEAPGEPVDVAQRATVSAPQTAPPSQDLSGNLVRYEAENMLDGVPETCWRMPGDGTGETITFQLAEETTLTSLGLVNGYAKVSTDGAGNTLDWYSGNRRITAAEWSFDDGTTVIQDLETTTDLQTIDVEAVTTETVQLRLVSVSAPGQGRAARNYTPISDVSLTGAPA